jgi:hypothetical protein
MSVSKAFGVANTSAELTSLLPVPVVRKPVRKGSLSEKEACQKREPVRNGSCQKREPVKKRRHPQRGHQKKKRH